MSFDPRNFKHVVVVSLAAASSQSVDPLFRFYCQGYFAHESSSSSSGFQKDFHSKVGKKDSSRLQKYAFHFLNFGS